MQDTNENVGGGTEINNDVNVAEVNQAEATEQTKEETQSESSDEEVELTEEQRAESFGNLDQAGTAFTVESFTKYMQDMKENEPAKFEKKKDELEKKLGELILAEKVNS